MNHEHEHDPAMADDVNRLGYLYETFVNHLRYHDERDAFTFVLAGAFAAEFAGIEAGAYPPPGHGYPGLDG
ncbi:hypothetical protein [Streptomyces sp. NPDC005423]|uniref:hypothetical protein n=1 Tax=Streptomyces sp. NPDC005423 TaxID=3155343 RepID=UPI0033B23493